MFSNEYIREYKSNLKIAYPVALSQLGHIAVGIADSVMVGALGGEPLASVTIAFSVMIPFMMLGIGISYGISPLIAKADGESNPREVASVFKNSLLLNMGAGILIALLLYVSSPLLRNLNQPEQVVEMAIPFFELLAISMVPLMFFQTYRQFAEGLAITRQAMYISISGNLLNILLNYLLIPGRFGFPALGVEGAGYATLISRIYMGLAMFAFIMYSPRFKKYRNLDQVVYSLKKVGRLFKMSIPVGIQLGLESGAFGFAAIMIGWLGVADEIAAHHIALNMAAVSYMAATGIAAAGSVRVGNEFGKGDYTKLRIAGLSAFHIVILFMGACAITFVLLRDYLPHLYIQDVKIESLTSSLLLICAFFQLSDGIQVVGLGALRGIGDVKIPTAIALISYWLIGIPIGYVFAFAYGLGTEGVWYGLFLGLLVAACALFIRFHIKSKDLLSEGLNKLKTVE